MSYKFQKQYRLPEYDYSKEGGYFITICTKNQEYYFGDIINDKMYLSEIGKIVRALWLEIPVKFKNVILDEWIIMPNHIHSIILKMNEPCKDYINNLNLINQIPTRFKSGIKNNPMELKEDTIEKIIRWFKGRVKFEAKHNGFKYFSWQSRFYDHIIRNEKSLNKIRQYIINNPLKWEVDKENPKNLYM